MVDLDYAMGAFDAVVLSIERTVILQTNGA